MTKSDNRISKEIDTEKIKKGEAEVEAEADTNINREAERQGLKKEKTDVEGSEREAFINSHNSGPRSPSPSDEEKMYAFFYEKNKNAEERESSSNQDEQSRAVSFQDSEPASIPSEAASQPRPYAGLGNQEGLDGSEDEYEIEDEEEQAAATNSRPGQATTTVEVARNAPRRNQLMRHLTRYDLTKSTKKIPAEISPALRRRLRDFNFAQGKRKEKYGEKNMWGIIGLYDFLSGIRTDVEWAEDAAWRREHNQPYLSWSDFDEAKDTGFNQPFFTYIVLFVCTCCLILSIGVNGWKVEPFSVNPMIGPSAETLIKIGAKKTSLIVDENQWYRLFSPMVLHAGVIHYILNMAAIWFIGYAFEMSHGFMSTALIFIVPAIGGNIMSALFLPEYISVGASGGIFGLIGGCLADIVSNWNLLFSKAVNPEDDGSVFRHTKVLIWLIVDILLNVLIGLTPFVDNFTHLGGMIYGFLCGLSRLERLSKAFFGVQRGILSQLRGAIVRFLGLILSCLFIMVSLIVLANSKGKRVTACKGCRYVSCVPFPFWAEEEDKWWYCDDCDTVGASVRLNNVTKLYTEVNVTCPDQEIITIDLIDENIGSKEYLVKLLPQYCREHCENLFADN